MGARLAMLAWLVAVWLLLWGSVTVGSVLSGVVVGVVVLVALPLPRVPVEGRVHPLSALWLGMVLVWLLVRSSLHVAWLSVRPGPGPQGAVLRASLELRSDFLLALAVNALNLIPGGLVVRIDPRRRFVYVHVLDAGDEKSVAAFRQQVEAVQRLFIRAFERPEDWRPSPLHDDAYCDESESESETGVAGVAGGAEATGEVRR